MTNGDDFAAAATTSLSKMTCYQYTKVCEVERSTTKIS